MQFLVAPTPILKILAPKDSTFETPTIKFSVFQLFLDFLKSVNSYVSAAANWLKPADYEQFRRHISEHIARNFPNVKTILDDWEKTEQEEANFLQIALRLLEFYKRLSPGVLETLGDALSLAELFRKILRVSGDGREIFVKAANLFVEIDAAIFLPNTELFALVVPMLLQFYHRAGDVDSRLGLAKIFKNTSIFQNHEAELWFWIDAVLNVKHFDEKLGVFVVEIFRGAHANREGYLIEDDGTEGLGEMDLENLREALEEIVENNKQNEILVKHVFYSPLICVALDRLRENRCKSVTYYLNCVAVLIFHLQTKPEEFLRNFDENLESYLRGSSLDLNAKGKLLRVFQEFLNAFFCEGFQGYIEENDQNFELHPDLPLNLLQLAVFHLSRSPTSELLANNCFALFKHLNLESKHLETIFSNPTFLENFQPLHANNCVAFITKLVKFLQNSPMQPQLNTYLQPYRHAIEKSVFKALKKLAKNKNKNFENLVELLEIFEIEREQCVKILENIGEFTGNDSETIYKIFVYSLKRFNELSENLQIFQPLGEKTVRKLSNFLAFLNQRQRNTENLAETTKKYLELFPHDLQNFSEILFDSILLKTDFCKHNAALAALLFRNTASQLETLKTNIAVVCNKKGLLLAILEKFNFENSELVTLIFENFKSALLKALLKPHKAGQHFQKHSNGVALLLKRSFPLEEIRQFLEKTHKFEVSEGFHAHFLSVLFAKYGFAEASHVRNAVLTLIHLALGLFKKITKDEEQENWKKLDEIIAITLTYLENVTALENLLQNESVQLFCKFCLKFGISSKDFLLKILRKLLQTANFTNQHASDLLEMIGAHSEFLDLFLNDDNSRKKELSELILLLCEKYPEILQKNHVPVFLAAYKATLADSDRLILHLLKL